MLKSDFIANIVKGEHKGEVQSVGKLWHDSRSINPTDGYVAIKGARVDGHDFVNDVATKGVKLVITERPVDCSVTQIIVPDTVQALHHLGTELAKKYEVMAVTGSCGKTSTKNMLQCILGQDSFMPQGNMNTDIGIPLALSEAPDVPYFIAECGMGKPGDIGLLNKILQPNVAIITNIYEAHIEYTGSLEQTAKEKGQLLNCADFGVVPADSPYYDEWYARCNDLFTFGDDGDAFVIYSDQDIHHIHCLGDEFEIKLNARGEHMLSNALAACLAARLMNIPSAVIQNGLADFKDVRLETFVHASGAQVYADVYNAIPQAVDMAMKLLPVDQGTKYLVISEMLELGDNSERLHIWIGEQAKALGFDEVFAVGPGAAALVKAHGKGMVFEDKASLVEKLGQKLNPGDKVLVKGARKYEMETIVKELKGGV